MRTSGLSDLPAAQRQRWAATRVWAARQAPYLATALLALEPVVVWELPPGMDLRAFPVDRAWHVYIDLEVLEVAGVQEVGFWLVHQVSHLLRRHAGRYPSASSVAPLADGRTTGGTGRWGGGTTAGRRPEEVLWNLATDAEIDDDLVAGELALPDGAVMPTDFACLPGWTAEQYWDALGGRDGGSGGAGGAGPEAAEPEGATSEGATSEGAGPARSRDCGSGCDGVDRPWDCGRPGVGPTGQRLVARDVARRIREHTRRRGDMPTGWQRWADGVLDPVVPWQRLLAAAVRRGVADVAGRVDFTYRRPSRRTASVPDVVLPSLRQPLPTVAMVLDTSGSMSDEMLAQSLAEVRGVLRGLGIGRRHLRVICCDASAYEAQRVLDARDVRLLGGGGTNMGSGLAAAGDLKPRPDLVVVLTDGHTPWPDRAPGGCRVVVGLMDERGTVPEWATSVRISDPRAGVGTSTGPGTTLAGDT